MGLYLCIFDQDEEIDGLQIGSYSDFGYLRDHIVNSLEDGRPGKRFPTLIHHSDCDGEWSISECETLKVELNELIEDMRRQPAVAFNSDWQREVAKNLALKPSNAYESFIDVNGELILERLVGLVDKAIERQLPIVFQ